VGLIGRPAEQRPLGEVLDGVRGGMSRTLVVCGAAGLGKTTLLDHAAVGRIVLVGSVEWQDQRERAVRITGAVPGVVAVRDELVSTDTAHVAVDVVTAIRRALVSPAKRHADGVTVLLSEGTVKLLGQVCCPDEHEAGLAAAWASTSVRSVDDRLTVVSR
jgi:osmotically-inducible protein OsmY